jgi:hypothetical protein
MGKMAPLTSMRILRYAHMRPFYALNPMTICFGALGRHYDHTSLPRIGPRTRLGPPPESRATITAHWPVRRESQPTGPKRATRCLRASSADDTRQMTLHLGYPHLDTPHRGDLAMIQRDCSWPRQVHRRRLGGAPQLYPSGPSSGAQQRRKTAVLRSPASTSRDVAWIIAVARRR